MVTEPPKSLEIARGCLDKGLLRHGGVGTKNNDPCPFAQTDELLATFRAILDYTKKPPLDQFKTSFFQDPNIPCKSCCLLGVPESGHLYLDPAKWTVPSINVCFLKHGFHDFGRRMRYP